ncbi:carbohydrate-binding protein [Chitinophaga barathri]|uniref:Carbohydrate-binding protein n=2 Tax=Chitinophaga barathri TaxID=1647451 RepID=A0A3N4MH08_9BACT|nr:carbohydrate-binding protein [Chitinophaga barathri]
MLCALLFLMPSTGIFAQGYLKASGQQIVNEKGENVLLRGIGLGGWMLQEGYMLRVPREGQQYRIKERIAAMIGAEKTQEFYDAWLANHTTRADIEAMKQWGFNSVRLPMHFNLYTLPADKEPVAGKDTWIEKGFTMTDSLLAWCKDNGLYLILDLHAAPGGQGNDLNISDRDGSKPSLWEDEAHQRKTVALWRKLAERYKNEPWIGAYDIINEPNFGFTDPVNDKNGTKEKDNARLRKLMVDITAAIREVDQKHIVIIEGNGWGNNYNGVLPLWDKNMVMSFHKYWNYNDEKSIAHILRYRQENNVPVWVGETGENSNVWFTEAIRLMENNNIGWAWWPLKKIGINNPLEVKNNASYQQMLAYWQDTTKPRPAADAVYQGLMELANATNFRNNVIHKDVLDAMLRQPANPKAMPFAKTALKTGTVISAVEYDFGANGYAYYDTDTANYRVSNANHTGGNRGGAFRNDGVDIRRDDTGYAVINIVKGEWLQYTVDVPKNATYTVKLLVAADADGGSIQLLGDGGKALAPAKPLAVTNGWQVLEIPGVSVKKGALPLRVMAETGGYRLREIRFE